ncbi:hypothetical protein ASPBRDRAFT_491018 [Aspergillus brasiliensis CBS 101740]|uniref:Uncharacterized protein n=1 Tax=Aspergillus brasiliensis (strain CBS 101740 / IMI 381727 / IBT 21946) TaxID=767769 RepID=A0A1L9UNB8_ASPBC|nr:hypothetical protein ASPBRDRAFT_491018 [Aspergillus brasiliensis CBS 101740]
MWAGESGWRERESEEGRRSGTRAAAKRHCDLAADDRRGSTNKQSTLSSALSPAAAKLFYSPCCPLLPHRPSFFFFSSPAAFCGVPPARYLSTSLFLPYVSPARSCATVHHGC